MGTDLLAGATWECTATPAGSIVDPDGLEGATSTWWVFSAVTWRGPAWKTVLRVW